MTLPSFFFFFYINLKPCDLGGEEGGEEGGGWKNELGRNNLEIKATPKSFQGSYIDIFKVPPVASLIYILSEDSEANYCGRDGEEAETLTRA